MMVRRGNLTGGVGQHEQRAPRSGEGVVFRQARPSRTTKISARVTRHLRDPKRSSGYVHPRPGAEPLRPGLFELRGEAEQQVFAGEITVELHADRQTLAVETGGMLIA